MNRQPKGKNLPRVATEPPAFALAHQWGFYILSGMISNASSRLIMTDDDSLILIGEYLELLSAAAMIASALLAIKYPQKKKAH